MFRLRMNINAGLLVLHFQNLGVDFQEFSQVKCNISLISLLLGKYVIFKVCTFSWLPGNPGDALI